MREFWADVESGQWLQLGGQSLLLLGPAVWMLAVALVMRSSRRRARRRALWLSLVGGAPIAVSIEGNF